MSFPLALTLFFEIAGIFSWWISSFVSGVFAESEEYFKVVVSDFAEEIMPVFFAKSSACFSNTRRFSAPVLKLSIKSDFLFALTPIRLAFIVSFPRRFKAVTKSLSFPPFQLKSIFFSPTE